MCPPLFIAEFIPEYIPYCPLELRNLDKTFGLGLLKDISPPKKKAGTTSSGW